jgi:hypothetical protein
VRLKGELLPKSSDSCVMVEGVERRSLAPFAKAKLLSINGEDKIYLEQNWL